MRRGKILRINLSEGCGFILDENNEEIVFQLKILDKSIGISDDVLFEIIFKDGGLSAINICEA